MMLDSIDQEMLAAMSAVAVAIGASAAEMRHWARQRRIAALAFGPSRRPMPWAYATPLLRVGAVALAAWALVTLIVLPPQAHRAGQVKPEEVRRLILVLDVSPSMKLADAGPQHKQRRDERAAEILKSFFDRVQKDRYRTTVIATYTEAKPVVQDTTDLEVVRNILVDLPLAQAFKAGTTNLNSGIEQAARIAQPWPPGSTILLIVSDGGDPDPTARMPKLPPAIGHVVVVGVGSATTGKFIDGVLSRQDVPSLRQTAARLQGTYHNGNELHLSTELVKEINQPPGGSTSEPWTQRERALLALACGGATFALLPLLLQLFGTRWAPGPRPAKLRAWKKERALV